MWVSGPATFATAGQGPSRTLFFHGGTARVAEERATRGENVAAEHASSSLALDRLLRAYVLDTQLGIFRVAWPGISSRTPRRSPT